MEKCKKPCRNPSDLDRHMRYVKCLIMIASCVLDWITWSSGLNTADFLHRSHQPENWVTCEICNAECIRPDVLDRHRKYCSHYWCSRHCDWLIGSEMLLLLNKVARKERASMTDPRAQTWKSTNRASITSCNPMQSITAFHIPHVSPSPTWNTLTHCFHRCMSHPDEVQQRLMSSELRANP